MSICPCLHLKLKRRQYVDFESFKCRIIMLSANWDRHIQAAGSWKFRN